MEDALAGLAQFAYIFVLIILNGFFAAAEFAIVSSNPGKLKSPEGKSKRGSRSALWLIDKLDLSLPTTQLGMTTTTLLLGWVGIRACYQAITSLITLLDLRLDQYTQYTLAILSSLILVTIVHVVLGELVAKSIALRHPERTLRLVAAPVALLAQILRPIVFLVRGAANLFLKAFKTSIPETSSRLHSLADLSAMVSESTEGGVIDEDEEMMIRGVFGFSDTVSREVMTPRIDLVTIDSEANLEEALSLIVSTGFSRFPVVTDRIDDVKGILIAKDILPYLACKQDDRDKEFKVVELMREPYFIPGTKPIDDLLNEFKKRKLHLAIVLDEHGGVDGVVTLEDLLEEIVGDIFDESDTPEDSIVLDDGGDAIIDGGISVNELNEELGLSIPEGAYDTIAGFIFTSLGRMPKTGDEILLSCFGVVLVAGSATEELAEDNFRDSSNGRDLEMRNQSASEQEEDPVKALLIVEKVDNHRIESVRLRQF